MVWRLTEPLSLDDARKGKRADISSLYDGQALHRTAMRMASQAVASSASMATVPPSTPEPSALILQLAGIDASAYGSGCFTALRSSASQGSLRPHASQAPTRARRHRRAERRRREGATPASPHRPPLPRAEVVQLEALLKLDSAAG